MNKKMFMNNYLFTLVLLCSLSVLPGCYMVDWFKDKMGQRPRVEKETMTASAEGIVGVINDGSKVLVTFKGAPVITEKSFAVKKQDLMESNPQYKEAVAMMGGEAKCDEYILEGLARTALLNQFIVDKGVDKKSDYQKDYDRAVSNIKDILNAKYFAQDIPVKVSDAEVSAFYEKNKDQLPGVRQSTGGIKSMGVSFDSDKAAQDFMAKVKEANGDIRKAAKDAGMAADKVQDFGLVHERSGAMNPTLKEKIMLITKFPSTMVIKVDDKTYWVVTATAKEAAKYTPLSDVKENFKKYLEQEKLGEAFEKEINKLKEKYQVTISGKEPMVKEEMPMTEPVMPMNKMQEPQKTMKPKTKAMTGTKSVKKEKTVNTPKVA